MGSWYSTCFMSHLPIMPGDDIRILILAPNYPDQKDGLTCYPNDRYTPIGFPIFAEYDDDTQVRNIREINEYTERYLKEFATIYRKTSLGDEDPQFEKYDFSNTTDFVENVIRGNLYIDRNRKKMRLEHVMIFGDLYNALIKNMYQRIPYGQKDSLGDLMYDRILKTIKWMKTDDDLIKELKKNAKIMETIKEKNIDLSCFRKFSDKIHIDSLSRFNTLDKMARYYIETEDGILLDDMLNYILWNYIMNYSRYGYHCVTGGGSQCQEMQLQKIIAEYIIVKCAEREIEQEDDYEDNVLEDTIYWWDKD